jgi:hypothetical protein
MSAFRQPVECALDVAADDADARELLWSVTFGNEQQRPHRRLPILGVVFYLPLRNRHKQGKAPFERQPEGD